MLFRSLRSTQPALSFQQRLMAVVRGPWLMATNEDARLPHAEGARPGRADKLFQNYLDTFIWLCADDTRLLDTFMGVSQLILPPTALFRPAHVLKVAQRLLRRVPPRGRPTDPIPPAPA